MITRISDTQAGDRASTRGKAHGHGLGWGAWLILALLIAGYTGFRWISAMRAGLPLDLPALIIPALLAAALGVLVLTVIELRVTPERFLDWQHTDRHDR